MVTLMVTHALGSLLDDRREGICSSTIPSILSEVSGFHTGGKDFKRIAIIARTFHSIGNRFLWIMILWTFYEYWPTAYFTVWSFTSPTSNFPFFSSYPSFYPLSCSWSFNHSCPPRLASRLELGSQVGLTTDHLSSCCLIQHTKDLSTMRAEPAEVIANQKLYIKFTIF